MPTAFPQPFTSSVSYWQASNRGSTSLWNHGRDDPLPETVVDYVIIGGGVTGASLAYHITRPSAAADGKSVVLLEAKDIASGATGRTGGHIAPASWRAFPNLTAPLEEGGAGLSEEAALHVLANEQDTLDYAEELVRKEKLDVDLWRGTKLEVHTTPEGVANNRRAMARYQEARLRHGTKALAWENVPDEQEAKKLALSLNRGPGGSCHPHRLATALVHLAMQSSAHFQLFSWTPVASLDKHGKVWKVDCGARGIVSARNVVVCSNGHTRYLLPELAEHVVPFRGHAAHIVPPKAMSGAAALTTSYAIERGPYLMFTPHAGLVMGVYNATALSERLVVKADIFDVEDDSVVLPPLKQFLATYGAKVFDEWTEEEEGEGLVRAWTGIMAASRDILPIIGPAPGKSGLWTAVGFHGHGMARILTCTRGLAHQMLTDEWDARLPSCFQYTDERLQRARKAPEIITAAERLERLSVAGSGVTASALPPSAEGARGGQIDGE